MALFCHFAIAIIIVVLLQEGHQKDLGTVTGGADTFFDKNQARSIDAFLARWTKVIAVGLFILAIVINVSAFSAQRLAEKKEKTPQ